MTNARVELHQFIFGLGLAACVSEPSEPEDECPIPGEEVVSESIDFLAVGHDFSGYCEGNFAAAQSHANWVAEAWGTGVDPFEYQLFETREDLCWPCDQRVACASPGLVAATTLPHRHEIAHVARPGSCFPLIEEGWAMLYGDHFQDTVTTGDIRMALDRASPGLAGEDYPLAARFVAFLIETRGVPPLHGLCGLPSSNIEEFEAAFATAYGESFDDLALEFEEYPEWSLAQLRQDQACENADVLVSPASWSFAMECGGEGVEGKEGEWFIAQRLVEIPQAGPYTFTTATTGSERLELRFEFRNCTRDGLASIDVINQYQYPEPDNPAELLLLDLPAGIYVVRVLLNDPPEGVELLMSVTEWP